MSENCPEHQLAILSLGFGSFLKKKDQKKQQVLLNQHSCSILVFVTIKLYSQKWFYMSELYRLISDLT